MKEREKVTERERSERKRVREREGGKERGRKGEEETSVFKMASGLTRFCAV